MKKETKETLLRLLLSLLVIAALVGGAYLALYLLGWTDLSQEELREFVAGSGAAAPLVYILIAFLQTTFVPIPAAVTILAGSYIFGAGYAFLYSYIGAMVGSIVAFALGKLLGRPFVNWITGGQEKTDEWLLKLHGKENVLLFFMFLFPFFPDDILCAVAGVLPISWGGFIAMQLVTRTTSIGCTVLFLSGEIIPFHGWGLLVLAAVAVLGVLAFILSMKYTKEIESFGVRVIEKITAPFRRKK